MHQGLWSHKFSADFWHFLSDFEHFPEIVENIFQLFLYFRLQKSTFRLLFLLVSKTATINGNNKIRNIRPMLIKQAESRARVDAMKDLIAKLAKEKDISVYHDRNDPRFL